MELLDSNVVSELHRLHLHDAIRDWIVNVPAKPPFVSAVTVGEVQASVEITREQDEAKAKGLEAWLEKVLAFFGALPMNVSAFQERVRLMHRKSDTLAEGAMIAATASVHRLTMATRNVGDFGRLGVALQNPFERK